MTSVLSKDVLALVLAEAIREDDELILDLASVCQEWRRVIKSSPHLRETARRVTARGTTYLLIGRCFAARVPLERLPSRLARQGRALRGRGQQRNAVHVHAVRVRVMLGRPQLPSRHSAFA